MGGGEKPQLSSPARASALWSLGWAYSEDTRCNSCDTRYALNAEKAACMDAINAIAET